MWRSHHAGVKPSESSSACSSRERFTCWSQYRTLHIVGAGLVGGLGDLARQGSVLDVVGEHDDVLPGSDVGAQFDRESRQRPGPRRRRRGWELGHGDTLTGRAGRRSVRNSPFRPPPARE